MEYSPDDGRLYVTVIIFWENEGNNGLSKHPRQQSQSGGRLRLSTQTMCVDNGTEAF